MTETTSKLTPNARPLVLGTLSFAISFAVWGLISAFAPRFRELFSLSGTQTALLVACRCSSARSAGSRWVCSRTASGAGRCSPSCWC